MTALKVRETYVNETKGYQFGESDVFEPYADTIGGLFRDCQQEFGRCIGKMYRDLPGGGIDQVGWVFQKRMQYEDARYPIDRDRDTYIREVWVEVFTEYETEITVTTAHPFV